MEVEKSVHDKQLGYVLTARAIRSGAEALRRVAEIDGDNGPDSLAILEAEWLEDYAEKMSQVADDLTD